MACWSLGGGAFRFDSKYVPAEAQDDFAAFRAVRAAHPDAPLTLFGHADATGQVAYNQGLSFERARAVFGVLTRDPAVWLDLWGQEQDGGATLRRHLREDGHEVEDEPGLGPQTRAAVEAHLELLFPGEPLPRAAFLGAGELALQGCSELNPVLVLSKALRDGLQPHERDNLNRQNRRVLAVFLDPGTRMDRAAWPCPAAAGSLAPCTQRAWSDAATRRAEQKAARAFRHAPGRP